MSVRLMAVAAIALVAVVGMILGGSAAGPYTATFTGAPASPLAVANNLSEFDVQVHSRDRETWYQLPPIQAQHGADCGAPPASHTTSSYEGSVFQCRDHIMTAINSGPGYAVIYLTPNQLFDFSGGGSVTWDLSTEQMSRRDWWDVLITPFADNLSVPLLSNLSQGVDLQGAPRNTIHIGTDNGEGSPVLTVVRNGVEQSYGNSGLPANANIPAGVNQAATRQTFKFTVGGGRMKLERLASATAPAVTFWDVAASVPFTSGVVQFGHHSYNPTKDGAGVPATWHWDNLSLNPATPFTMIKADRRYTEGGTVNFAAPAPANAFLRFSGICKVKVNGALVERAADYDRWSVGYHAEHMSSYWVPVAAGTQSVDISFADDGWYTTNNGCLAKDFSIWSLGGSTPPTATRTSTPVAPTATPSAPPASASLSGVVTLEGRPSAAGVTVRLAPGNRVATTSASGSFAFTGLAPGQYTVTAEAPGFVPAIRPALGIAAGGNTLAATQLKAGDIDGDDAVTIVDVSLVAGAFGEPANGGSADLNATGTIDITDVSLTAGNFGLAGPSAW